MHKGAVLAALAGGIIVVSGGVAAADSGATGAALGSPGVLSGNVIQLPINIPVNLCGDSIDVIGLLNPAFGNTCANASSRVAATPAVTSTDSSGSGDNSMDDRAPAMRPFAGR
ncbi:MULTISPECIES: chaplin [unclassified Streptomyces]|uniref:chaplin n=1 Tax=unclassified Streptomyces TaxID=2593676 RepID=UPI000B882C7A|nr:MULTISPECIES: chaplin [unclassified Streptomyces]MYS24096.1 DUF320 domain-containing protein [Streptomyces sp. SID4948]